MAKEKCSITKAGEFYKDITQMVVGKATTIKAEGDKYKGMTYYFNPSQSKKYGKKGQYWEMAQSKRNKIQKYLDSQAELPPPLNFGWINGPHTDPRTGKNWLSVIMPKYTAEAIDLKDKMEKEKQKEIEKLNLDVEIRNIEEGTQLSFDFSENGNELTSLDIERAEDADLFQTKKNIEDMSFPEYRAYKIKLFNSLQEQFEVYKKAVRNSVEKQENIRKYTKLIGDLGKEIEELNEKNFESVEQDVRKELSYIESVINTLDVESIEFSSIMERLEAFCDFFLGTTIKGVTLGEKRKKDFVNLKVEGLKSDFLDEIKSKVIDLSLTYQEKEGKLISTVIDNNASIKEHLDSGVMTAKDVEDLKAFIDNQTDINQLKALMMGIHSGGGPLGQIFGTFWEAKVHGENGATAGRLKIVKEIVKELNLDTKFFEKKEITDNGSIVSTGRLIHPYTKDYFSTVNAISGYQKQFFSTSGGAARRKAYKEYMNAKKDSQEILDIRKIKEFKNKYGHLSFAEKVFIFSDKEMDDYERKIKAEVGKELFEFIMEEQRELLLLYEASLKNSDSEIDFIKNSPFYFASHFDSPSYSLPVINTANYSSYYPVSSYNVFFPKKEKRSISKGVKEDSGFYDQDFKNLFESESDYRREKIFTAWKNYADLLINDVNRTLKANGMNVHSLDIPLVYTYIAKELLKSRNIVGIKKVGYLISSVFNIFKKTFYNASYLRDPERIGKESDKVFINYRNPVRNDANKHFKVLMSYSYEKIKQIAEREKIGARDISDILANAGPNGQKVLETQEKARLARLIANKRAFSEASSDMFSTLEALVEITNLTKARVASMSFAKIVQSYIKSRTGAIQAETPEERNIVNTSLPILEDFFEVWIKSNIYGHALAAEKKGWMYKVSSVGRNSKRFRYYTHQEKEFKKLLKETLKDVKDPNLEFEFKSRGVLYKRMRDKDGNMRIEKVENTDTPMLSTVTKITDEEFIHHYENYFMDSLDKTGIPLTIGSFIQGLLQIRTIKSLALNLKSGFTNRESGKTQTNIMAASGRLGFDEESIDMARRMLRFYNVQRYINATPGFKKLSVFYKSRALQIRTLDLLAKDFFKILQDKKDQYARAEEYSHQKLSTVFSLMDFSVNNPENHNQLEIVLGILAKVEVYDNEGNKHMFIENEKFTMYEPGTLEIKKEFRNGFKMVKNEEGVLVKVPTDNVRIWENFQESSEKGKLNTHLHILNKITRAIDRTQGNYNNKDIAKIFSSTAGKSLMLFKRYLPEQVNANFGTMDWDLATGKAKYEGRKKVLFRHAPTAFAHIVFSTGISTGFFLLIPLPVFATILGIGGSLSFFMYKFFKMSNKQSLKLNRDTALTIIDYTQEVLLRSLDLPFRMISTGKHRNFSVTVNGKSIRLNAVDLSKSITNKISPLSKEEREIISESVQELVQTIKYKSGILLTSYAVQALYAALQGGDDDDDEKLRIMALKKYEKTLNLISNRVEMLVDELNMYSNPNTFIEEMGQIMLVRDLEYAKGIIGDLYDYYTLEEEFPGTGRILKSIFNPIPIPNSISDMAFTPGTTFWGDNRKYEPDWTDLVFKPDAYVDEIKYRNIRKAEKKDLTKMASKELKKKFPDWNKSQIEKEAKRISTAIMAPGQQLGLKRINYEGSPEYESYGEFLDRTDEYEVFSKEEKIKAINSRIEGFYNIHNQYIRGSKQYRDEEGWE